MKLLKKLDKRGFTMVELLATIVIIGILGTIGVVGVTRSMKSAKDRYYIAQNKLFLSAAQTYFTDDKSRLPLHEPLSKTVTLEELINKNYIEKILDYNKDPYDVKKSKARVTNLGLSLYAYESVLVDKNGKYTEWQEKTGTDETVVNMQLDNNKFNSSNPEPMAYTNNKKNIHINIKDKDGIAGYIISIQKNNKTIEEGKYVCVGGKEVEYNTDVIFDKNKYSEGKYKVKIKVYDQYNNQKTFTSGTLIIDITPPTCKYEGSSNNWTNKSRLITYTGEDNLSGIDEETIKKQRYGEANQVILSRKGISYTIKDKAGNSTNCDYSNNDINIYYDSVKPECSYLGESTTWSYEDRKITVGCYDGVNSSDCVLKEITETFNKSAKTAEISKTIEDNAGNKTLCKKTVNIYIDKKLPNVSINNNYDNVWKGLEFVDADKYKFKVNTSNIGISGLKQLQRKEGSNGTWENVSTTELEYTTSSWKKERNSKIYYRAVSVAAYNDNSTNPKTGKTDSTTVKIDRHVPNIEIEMASNTKVKISCSDEGGSGVDELNAYNKTSNPIYHTYESAGKKNPSATCKDKAGNSSEKKKTYNCSWKSCENAACGVLRYNACRAAGCASYNAYGGFTSGTGDKYSASPGKYCKNAGDKYQYNATTQCCRTLNGKCIGNNNSNTGNAECECRVRTCNSWKRSSVCGVEKYNSCATSACGLDKCS